MKGYDRWKLSSGYPSIIVGECEQCGGEIGLNEEFYKTNRGRIHLDCYRDYCDEYFESEIVEGFYGGIDWAVK